MPLISRVKRGHPLPLGTTVHRAGINFSIFSKHATACCLLVSEMGEPDKLVELPLDPESNRTGQVWHIFIEGLDVGAH